MLTVVLFAAGMALLVLAVRTPRSNRVSGASTFPSEGAQ